VADLLATADVMALPSHFEGTAGIALEALAIGTPIVSTRLEGLDGIVVDEVNALAVAVGDVRGLAAAISRMLDDPPLAERLATRGRADFEGRFTIDRAADGMVAMYRSVMSR
ncbi:MAG TPA: glycosyltransferase family 4 protein, partial [Ilumatobacteraceae bacterium]